MSLPEAWQPLGHRNDCKTAFHLQWATTVPKSFHDLLQPVPWVLCHVIDAVLWDETDRILGNKEGEITWRGEP